MLISSQMSTLFLASSIADSGWHIAKKIKVKKAAFIFTAGEVEKDDGWLSNDRNGLNKNGIKTFDYTITGKTIKDFEHDLGNCDLIHVNGGNTYYLLLHAKKSGFDKFIKRQVNKGVIYTGSSAGSMITGSDITITWRPENEPYAKELSDTKGFDLVDLTIFPHWGNSHFNKIFFDYRLKNAYKDFKGNKIILLNDDQYVEVHNSAYKIVDVTKERL